MNRNERIVKVWALMSLVGLGCSSKQGELDQGEQRPSSSAISTPSLTPPKAANEAGGEWWTPPAGERSSVEALAHAFAGIDEKDLGALYDGHLKPIYGSASLYETHEPRRIRRGEMYKSLTKLSTSTQLDAGFSVFIASFGTTYTTSKSYQLYRAMDVRVVIRLDETKRMRQPPPKAVYYLAEVHIGASYDLLIEGEHEAMGNQLDLLLSTGSASVSELSRTHRYRVNQRGLGLEPKTRDAIFVRNSGEVALNYETTAAPMPVQLVFRTIPGRLAKSTKLRVPKPPIIDETEDIPEGESVKHSVAQGRYVVSISSEPTGVIIGWRGDVRCDSPPPKEQTKQFKTTCTLKNSAILQVHNDTGWMTGPTEHVSIYIAQSQR